MLCVNVWHTEQAVMAALLTLLFLVACIPLNHAVKLTYIEFIIDDHSADIDITSTLISLINDWQTETSLNITYNVDNIDLSNQYLVQQTVNKPRHPATAIVLITNSCDLLQTLKTLASQFEHLYYTNTLPCERGIPIDENFEADLTFRFIEDMFNALGWEGAHIYFDAPNENKISRIVESKHQFNLIEVVDESPESIHQMLKDLHTEISRKRNNIVICTTNISMNILKEAQKLDNTDEYEGAISLLSKWLLIVPKDFASTHINDVTRGFSNLAIAVESYEIDAQIDSILFARTLEELTTIVNNSYNDTESVFGLKPLNQNEEFIPYEIYTISGDIHVSAHWSPHLGLEVKSAIYDSRYQLNGLSLRVGVQERNPYMSKNASDAHTGFLVDLLEMLAEQLNFTYTLLESPDNQVGVRSDTGEWTGLIGMLERKELDLIVGPVSMTHDRDSVLDFSYPFHTDQYGVLYKRIDPASMKWRLFMEPFKWRVWVCVAISIPFVAMVIWAMNKTSPYYTVAERNTGFGNFTEALLFTYGSLCQQGGVYQPAALSGRFVVGFWWVFAIASVATYTGNLIAFLTVSIDFKPFKSVQEMVVGKHSYGFVGGTDLEDLLEGSSNVMYQDLWRNIQHFNETDPEVLSTDADVHIDRVTNGDYAFIADMTTIDVAIMDNCGKLNKIEENIWLIHYSLGFPEGSALSEPFSDAILLFHEIGLMSIWRNRHFSKDKTCVDSVSLTKPASMDDIQGPLIILVICIVACVGCLMIELGIAKYKQLKGVSPTPTLNCERENEVNTPSSTRSHTGLIKVDSREFLDVDSNTSRSNSLSTPRHIQLAFHK